MPEHTIKVVCLFICCFHSNICSGAL